MFLENKGKGLVVLVAQGFKNLMLKPKESVEIQDFVYEKFKASIDTAVESFGLLVSAKPEKKIEKKVETEPVAPVVEKVAEEVSETDDLEEAIESAKNDVLLAEEQLNSLPEDAHHNKKKAASRRLDKAKQALESLLGGL